MAGNISTLAYVAKHRQRRSLSDPLWVRILLIGSALLFAGLFLIVPLAAVFAEALRKGVGAYFAAFGDKDAMAAIRLTLIAAGIAVWLLDGLAVRFSMGAFGLIIDTGVLTIGLVAGLLLGVIGALPPAWRCLRLPIPTALKNLLMAAKVRSTG